MVLCAANVDFWHLADIAVVAPHMSAFRGKADMRFALHMSAYDPKRTFKLGVVPQIRTLARRWSCRRRPRRLARGFARLLRGH